MVLPIGSTRSIPPMEKPPILEGLSERKTSLLEVAPFANIPTNQLDFEAQVKLLDQQMDQELDAFIFHKERKIESHLKQLEKTKQKQKVVRSILDIQKWAHEYADTSKDNVQDGIGFLKTVLPAEFMDEDASDLPKTLENIDEVLNLAGFLLSSIDNGSVGITLICKAKILHAAKRALDKLIENYKEKITQYEQDHKIKIYDDDVTILPTEELRIMKNSIREMKNRISEQENELLEQKVKFAKKSVKTSLATSKLIFKSLEGIFQYAKVLGQVASILYNAVSIVFNSINAWKDTAAKNLYQKWTTNYADWKAKHQPTFKIDGKNEPVLLNPLPPTQPSDLIEEEYVDDLVDLIDESPSIDSVREKLLNEGIELEGVYQNKEELVHRLKTDTDFAQNLIDSYLNYQRSMEAIDELISSSKNLLEKRELIVEKKLIMLTPHLQILLPKIKQMKMTEFNSQADQTAITFEEWFAAQSPENENDPSLKSEKSDRLLRFYIDHQETLEIATKNAIKEMVSKKQEIDKIMIKSRWYESISQFFLSTTIFSLSIAFTVIGLITTPVGGVGIIFLALSIPSLALSLGFMTINYINNSRTHPALNKEYTKGTNIKLLYASLRGSIAEYQHAAKQKMLIQTSHAVRLLHAKVNLQHNDVDYHKALEAYKKAKQQFIDSQAKVDHWQEKIKNYKGHLHGAAWADFARQADLKVNQFDPLKAFNHAMGELDLSLLNPETQELLKMQLGMDLESLQSKMDENPDTIKNALQKFFTMNDADYLQFIQSQTKSLQEVI